MAERNEIREEMRKKVFISCFSRKEVVFVDSINDLTEEQLTDTTKAYFDGIFILDGDNQDDISRVVSITKRGRYVNLQDYYESHGAFDENPNKFFKAIKNLKDKEISESNEDDIQDISDIKDEALIELLYKSVDELNLSLRASNCLKNANVRTIGELTKKTEEDLSKTRNFGKTSLLEVKEKLYELGGLTLGMRNYRNVNLPTQKKDSAESLSECDK